MARSTLVRRIVRVAAFALPWAAAESTLAQRNPCSLDSPERDALLAAYNGVDLTHLGGELNAREELVQVGDPEHVQAADFDNDGDLDLVSANAESQNLAVYFQDGSAASDEQRFPSASATSLADSEHLKRPRWVRAVDLDDDGRQDLAVASHDGAAVVLFYQPLEGQGPVGTFPQMVSLPLPTGDRGDAGPSALTAVDLDGDQLKDLAVTDARNKRIHILRQANGSFSESVLVDLDWETHRIEAADLDGTGGPDLVVLSSLDARVTFLLNYAVDGGAFASRSHLQFEEGSLPQSLQVLDLSADARADLAIAVNRRNEIQLFTAAIEGQLPMTPMEPLPVAPGPVAVAFHRAGDNLDGSRLAVAAFRSSAVQLVRDPLADRRFLSWEGVRGPKAVVCVDLDGDGSSELIAANLFFNRLSVYWDISALEGSDVDQSGVLDECEGDCNRNGLPDAFEIARGAAEDCNLDGRPDSCDLPAPDCDNNGEPDACDLRSAPERDCDASQTLDSCEIRDGVLLDTDGDGIPDPCDTPPPVFHRGDADGNGFLELTDSIRILSHLFLGGPAPLCRDIADADDNGKYELTDAIRILSHLFLGARGPEAPGPPEEPCGPDPTLDAFDDDENCATYEHC